MTKATTRRLQLMKLSDIKPAKKNPKRHADEAITGSVDRFGYVEAMMLDDRTGRLVAGHGRLEALAALKKSGAKPPAGVLAKGGHWLVPVQRGWASKNDREAEAYLVASNRTVELGGWDDAELAKMLKGMPKDLMSASGFDVDDLNELIRGLGDVVDDGVDDEPTIPRVAWVKPGQLFQLGEHRLLCGDSTNVDHVSRLMNGQLAKLVFTDPPYGVSYAAKNEFLNAVARGNRIQDPIENDHLSVEEMGKFWEQAFTRMFEACEPGAAYYVTGPQGGDLSMMMMMMQKAGWLLKHVLIWVKNNHVLGRCDYHYKHEPILYGWKPGAGHYWAGGNSEMSVWEVDRPQTSDQHPTTKPVALYERAIENSSKPGDQVLDLFVGSGTMLAAAERTGRRAFAMELDPVYCGVAIERWEKLSGGKHEVIK